MAINRNVFSVNDQVAGKVRFYAYYRKEISRELLKILNDQVASEVIKANGSQPRLMNCAQYVLFVHTEH